VACNELDEKEQMAELGDVLFSVINYARFKNLNPEEALERTNKKFISRFQYLEKCIIRDGKNWEEMSLSEMDVYWDEAKKLGL
jgi:XTP/dITP diphosphohydrolase